MKKFAFVLILALLISSCSVVCLPLVSQAASEVWLPSGKFVSGGTYMFSVSGINAYGESGGHDYTFIGEESKGEYGIAYESRPLLTAPVSTRFQWVVTEGSTSGTYSFRSVSSGKYLNMGIDPDKKDDQIWAYLSNTPQYLNVTLSGGTVKIWIKEGSETYYLRFTNIYGTENKDKTYSCWHAGTGTSSGTFTIYAKGAIEGEYKNTTKPLFTVATFADLHVDYGIQSWSTPIREGTIRAAEYIRDTVGAADVVLVGGDITSRNDTSKAWTNAMVNRSLNTIYSTMSKASKNGKVLFVSGNHEIEAGVAAGNTVYSGDYDQFMTSVLGEFDAALHFNDMGIGTSKFNELLCYRYSINNIEFIGINTPYRSARSSGYIYLEQIQWIDRQMASIGKDKTVVLQCHYPIEYIGNAPGQSGASAAMDAMLKKYPNAIYCYGHVHGTDDTYAWLNSSELVVPTGSATKTSSNAYNTSGYINAHMGSMGYYNNQFQPGGLQAAEPMINQFLYIEFYLDHITFKYYNTGARSAIDGVYEISSYTVMRDLSSQLSASSGSTNTGTNTGTSSNTGSNTGSGTGNSGAPTDTNTDTGTPSDVTDSGAQPSGTTSGSDLVPGTSSGSDLAPTDADASFGALEWIVLSVSCVVLLFAGAFAGWYFFLRKKK